MISGRIDDIDDVIPESILSLAKDARYISQCQILLQQAFDTFLIVREQQQGVLSSSSLDISGSGEEEEQKQREILMRIRKQTTWYISFILYICLVVIPTGKTLGMEACGLSFSNNDVVTTNQTQPATASSTTATAISTRRNCSILAGVSLFLAAASGLIREYYSAASIHTSSAITNNNNNNNNNDENGSSVDNQQQQQQQQERLRGRERNMMHERLRRQMLERAKAASALASPSANSSCDGIVVDDEGRRDKNQDLTLSHGENIIARRVKETSSLPSSLPSLSSSSKRLLSIFQRLSKVSCY
jgi:hypothetical protein